MPKPIIAVLFMLLSLAIIFGVIELQYVLRHKKLHIIIQILLDILQIVGIAVFVSSALYIYHITRELMIQNVLG